MARRHTRLDFNSLNSQKLHIFKKIALATAIAAAAFSTTASAGDLRLGTTSNGGTVVHYGVSKIGMGGLYLQYADVDREDEDSDLPAYNDQSLALGWAMGTENNQFYWNGELRNRFIFRGSLLFSKFEALEESNETKLDSILNEDGGIPDFGLSFGLDMWMKRYVVGADVVYNGIETSGRVTLGVGF